MYFSPEEQLGGFCFFSVLTRLQYPVSQSVARVFLGEKQKSGRCSVLRCVHRPFSRCQCCPLKFHQHILRALRVLVPHIYQASPSASLPSSSSPSSEQNMRKESRSRFQAQGPASSPLSPQHVLSQGGPAGLQVQDPPVHTCQGPGPPGQKKQVQRVLTRLSPAWTGSCPGCRARSRGPSRCLRSSAGALAAPSSEGPPSPLAPGGASPAVQGSPASASPPASSSTASSCSGEADQTVSGPGTGRGGAQ